MIFDDMKKLNEPTMKYDPVLIPVIRKVMPSIIAQDIVGVQSMINPFSIKWERVGIDGPSQRAIYNIRNKEVREWVEEQPTDMWQQYGGTEEYEGVSISTMFGQNYVFSKEMEAWFTLRWS